ncbi:MAG: sugar porter family MFS transporter [Flavobacteriaceae bacterium]|nr:sugar porter family MFS transporter [Flavobacteriaceae bacterium]
MKKNYTLFISFIVALGGFLLGFDSAVISGTINGIRMYFNMSDWQLGFSVGCVIFGAMVGNIVSGPLSDKYGRKKVLLITSVLFTISAIWSALATTYITFVIARIIGGIGIGGAILIAPIYIAEVAPPKLRGSLVSLNQLNIVIGISLAYFSNYFLKDVNNESWRWMLGVEAFPAIIYFIALFTVPRSPRWLIQKLNLIKEARKILIKIGGEAHAQQTIEEVLRSVAKKVTKATLSDLFKSKMRVTIIIAFGIAFFQQITGINAIFYYAPTIFEQAGGSADSSFIQAIVVGLTNFIFTLIAIKLIDKLGRKPLLIIGTSAMTIALSLSTFSFYKATYKVNAVALSKVDDIQVRTALESLKDHVFESQTSFVNSVKPLLTSKQLYSFKRTELKNFISINATLVLIAILLYVAAFAISLGPVMWTLLSEIFPGNIKGIAISAVGFFNSLISFTVTQFFPWELTNIGPTMTFAIYAVLALLSLLFVYKFVVETKGKTLEEVQELLINA